MKLSSSRPNAGAPAAVQRGEPAAERLVVAGARAAGLDPLEREEARRRGRPAPPRPGRAQRRPPRRASEARGLGANIPGARRGGTSRTPRPSASSTARRRLMSPPATGRPTPRPASRPPRPQRPVMAPARAQVPEQTRAGALDHVEDVLEAVGAAVVRVGHVRSPPAGAGRTRAAGDLRRASASGATRRRSAAFCGPSRSRSRSGEVGRRELPRAALHDDPARQRLGGRPRVGRVADVLAAGAGAVDLERAVEPGGGDRCAHHRLGRRRAADVAQADEDPPHGRDASPPPGGPPPRRSLVAGPSARRRSGPSRAPAPGAARPNRYWRGDGTPATATMAPARALARKSGAFDVERALARVGRAAVPPRRCPG